MKNLFLTNEKSSKKEYKKIMKQTVNAVTDAFGDSKAYSGPTPQQLQQIVRQDSILPPHGLGWEETLKITKEKILPNLLRTSSTDYMPHLHSPATLESIAGEVIISAFNQSMDSWDQAPVATEIEVEVINHLCSLFGYSDESDGVFTSGGSQSNQTAIILARDWFISRIMKYDVKKHGLPQDFRKLRMYTSEISHFSMEKSAHILGLGYESVVKVPVNEAKQMVQSLHNDGISVIMDVVYNHVYDAESFSFNQIVPKYFSRTKEDGSYNGDTGCGNTTASERTMVQKYIVDSVCSTKITNRSRMTAVIVIKFD